MAKKLGKNNELTEQSRRILIAEGIREFADVGYARGSTNRIIERADMNRGTLYYHFGDKQGLYRAIYAHLTAESAQLIRSAHNPDDDRWTSFLKAGLAFIDHAADPTFRKIVLIEAQVALGYRERLEINRHTLMGAVQEYAKGLMDHGDLPARDLFSTSVLIFGIMAETGRSFELVEAIEPAVENAREAFVWSMNALRASSP